MVLLKVFKALTDSKVYKVFKADKALMDSRVYKALKD